MGTKRWPLSVLMYSGLIVVVCLMAVGTAQAVPIPTTCNGGAACNGATYAVVVTSPSANNYQVQFVIDLDGYNGSTTDFVNSVQFALEGVGTYTGLALTSAPGGAANWTVSTQELNANGCTGGGNHRRCAEGTASLNGGEG